MPEIVVSLPQPLPSSPSDFVEQYIYLTPDELKKRYFSTPDSISKEGTLVWVLKSKGRRPSCQRQTTTTCSATSSGWSSSRTELFSRARVGAVSNGTNTDGRIPVRYPMGSTYQVRINNLIPVLDAHVFHDYIVLVTGETFDYRRMAAVHTCVGESFLEIGCDFGPCTDRVRQVLAMNVPPSTSSSSPTNTASSTTTAAVDPGWSNNSSHTDDVVVDGVTSVIGVDRSFESIAIAKERYPESCFFHIDNVLTDNGASQLRDLCTKNLGHTCPSVVAIDINGSRDLPAVLECIQMTMQNFVSSSTFYDTTSTTTNGELLQTTPTKITTNYHNKQHTQRQRPRLIIVKSRTLLRFLQQHKELDK